MSRPCERCKALPPTITEGPWRGQMSMHGYCAACSKDLCEACLAKGKCRESPTGKHVKENDSE